MDFRTVANEINNMDADKYRDYFKMDKSEGTMPDNPDDYFNPKTDFVKAEGTKAAETAASKMGGISGADGPDSPQAEPGEAPGAMKDYSEFRDKYGLEFNEEHSKMKSPGAYSKSSGGDGFASDDGAIFTESGVYVGTAKGTENEDGDMVYDNYGSLESASSGIKQKAEGKGWTDFSSLSDVAGAVHWLTKDDKPKGPEKEPEPYRKSDTLARAEAGVKAYEETILPRQGDIMFGKNPDYAQKYADSFQANLRSDPDYAWKFKKEGQQTGQRTVNFSGMEEEDEQL